MKTPHNDRHDAGFTLIELMAVVVVIAVLAAITFGVTGYLQKRMAIQKTHAQVGAMEVALENFKLDYGYYPPTAAGRISANGYWEATNNWILYCALTGTGNGYTKHYLTFAPDQIRRNASSGSSTIAGYQGSIALTNVYDSWGRPFNYYNSPTTPRTVVSTNGDYGYVIGGQVNLSSFDLFSYGPDGCTYAAPNASGAGWSSAGANWAALKSALDDIANFGH